MRVTALACALAGVIACSTQERARPIGPKAFSLPAPPRTSDWMGSVAQPDRAIVRSGLDRIECWSLEEGKRLWCLDRLELGAKPGYARFTEIALNWVVEWPPVVCRLEPSNGRPVWKFEGRLLLADAKGIVLGSKDEDRVVARSVHDLDSGKLRWEMPEPAAPVTRPVGAWCAGGLFVIERSRERSRLRLLRAEDGAEIWSRGIEGWAADLAGSNENRALVRSYNPRCAAGPKDIVDFLFSRWHRNVGNATCIRYELIDLASGRTLWEASTGERDHSVGHHGEPSPEAFNPHYGGPVKWFGQLIAHYDLRKEELQLVRTSDGGLAETRPLPGGLEFGTVELAASGLRLRSMEGQRKYVDWLYRPDEKEWIRTELRSEQDAVWWINAKRAIFDRDRPTELELARLGRTGWQSVWRLPYTRQRLSGGGYLNAPIIDVDIGVLAIFETPTVDRMNVRIYELETGKPRMAIETASGYGRYWTRFERGRLVLPSDDGFDIHDLR